MFASYFNTFKNLTVDGLLLWTWSSPPATQSTRHLPFRIARQSSQSSEAVTSQGRRMRIKNTTTYRLDTAKKLTFSTPGYDRAITLKVGVT